MTSTRLPAATSEESTAKVEEVRAAPARETFNLTTLIRVIRRRRRPFVITLVAVTLVQAGRTLHNLYFNPVY
jgi:uncharacterized protein involved in exopolysaccharide biosynthesis